MLESRHFTTGERWSAIKCGLSITGSNKILNKTDKSKVVLSGVILPKLQGQRLDQALACLFPGYSRAQLQKWIKQGGVFLDELAITKIRQKVIAGQSVLIRAELPEKENWAPQNLGLDLVYEDDSVLVVNKPAGLTVHPGGGQPDNTLVNALLYHFSELSKIPRAGIVHRLDKNTSGILVVARTLESYTFLVKTIQQRDITREYEGIVNGRVLFSGKIETKMGRHPTQRTKMAVLEQGKEAITHYRVIERFRKHTYLSVTLATGRTHQIRVHMAYLGHPLVGDSVYGGKVILPKDPSRELRETLTHFKRQALHAKKLSFAHPSNQKRYTLECPLPEDMVSLLEALRGDKNKNI